MGLLDLLLSAGKTAADYAQKNPQTVLKIVEQFRPQNNSNKEYSNKSHITNTIGKYDIRAKLRSLGITNAHTCKVIRTDHQSLCVDVFDVNCNFIVQFNLKGDKVDGSYILGQVYAI